MERQTHRRKSEVVRSGTHTLKKTRKAAGSEERRLAILEAGLSVFAAGGFEAAKLDDVAVKAGIAKGTIYLYFTDKHDLFEQIVRHAVTPVLGQIQDVVAIPDLPTDELLARIFEVFRTEVLLTDRKLVIRLVLTEGSRFPKIAAFYHREVIAKGLALIRRVAERGIARGELASDAIEKFPHLVFAPVLLSVIWDGVFSRIEPLDVEGLLAAHRKVLIGSGNRRRTGK
jgi:AcrR family transcriptional regulator